MNCCNDCIYLDKTQKSTSNYHNSYIYGCLKYGVKGVCCANWIDNDEKLKTIGCSDFKQKEENVLKGQVSIFDLLR